MLYNLGIHIIVVIVMEGLNEYVKASKIALQ